jgi:repressor LexA
MSRTKTVFATPRQLEVLGWIEDFIRGEGIPPTIREIAWGVGVDHPNVVYFLKELERKGYLRRRNQHARSLIIERSSAPGRDRRLVPLMGEIAAGSPLLAEENLEGYLDVSEELLPRTGMVFALRVRGDSMIGAGIVEGDRVLLRKQETAEGGEIVGALKGGEATVKRFKRIGRSAWLYPENDRYQPIRLGPDGEDRIIGKVIGLLRRYE